MAVYVVLGANAGTTSRLVVNASQGTAGAEETFTFDISDPVAGDVVAFWGGRPMAQGGLWTEGYGLGTVVPQPIVLDVFWAVEDASGGRCGVRNPLQYCALHQRLKLFYPKRSQR